MTQKNKKKLKTKRPKIDKRSPLFAAILTFGIVVLLFLLSMFVLVPSVNRTNQEEERVKVMHEKQRFSDAKNLLDNIRLSLTANPMLGGLKAEHDSCTNPGTLSDAVIRCEVYIRLSKPGVDSTTYSQLGSFISQTLEGEQQIEFISSPNDDMLYDNKLATSQEFIYKKYPELSCRESTTLASDNTYQLFISCSWTADTYFYAN